MLEASTARLAARGAKCDSQFDCDFSYRRSVAGLRWEVKSRGAVPRQADLRPCVSLAPFGFWRVVSDSKRQGAVLAEGRCFGCDRRFARCRLYSRQSASVSPILDCESRRGCSLKRGSLDQRSAVSLVWGVLKESSHKTDSRLPVERTAFQRAASPRLAIQYRRNRG